MPADKAVVGVRLRNAREERGWSREASAARLRSAGEKLPGVVSLAHMIKEWEAGKHAVSDRYQVLYCRVFGIPRAELFGTRGDASQLEVDPFEVIELARQADASDLGADALDDIALVTDRLCRDYPSMAAPALRSRTERALRYVLRLLDGRTTLQQHRELLVQAGWLAALLGCVDYDLGWRDSAEIARKMAYRLGEQSDHAAIIGWAWEIAAWFALTEGRYRDALAATKAGRERVATGNAGAQLLFQEARALARMGDAEASTALRKGAKILQCLPIPEHPEHHFTVDHAKYEFYVSTILTWLGREDDVAEEHAREVISRSSAWPMRSANARIDLGLVAGRRGDLDEAIDHGRQALRGKRRSAQLLPRAVDLHHRLGVRYPKEPIVIEYEELLREERRALPPGGR